MPILYVTEPGATIRLSGESICVTVEEPRDQGHGTDRRKTLMEVESHRLEQIAIVGVAHITSTALHFCLEKGIDVAWLTRGGEFLGRTVTAMPRSADLRLCQFQATADSQMRLARARQVVHAKLFNACGVLRDIQSNDAGNRVLSHALSEVKRIAAKALESPEPAKTLGLEGAGARAYFTAFGASFKGEITFGGRRHRPATDPANALLSFGYVILGNRLAGLLEARGLDPCL